MSNLKFSVSITTKRLQVNLISCVSYSQPSLPSTIPNYRLFCLHISSDLHFPLASPLESSSLSVCTCMVWIMVACTLQIWSRVVLDTGQTHITTRYIYFLCSFRICYLLLYGVMSYPWMVNCLKGFIASGPILWGTYIKILNREGVISNNVFVRCW